MACATSWANDLKLWYQQPAKDAMTEALPVGNGRIGGVSRRGRVRTHPA